MGFAFKNENLKQLKKIIHKFPEKNSHPNLIGTAYFFTFIFFRFYQLPVPAKYYNPSPTSAS